MIGAACLEPRRILLGGDVGRPRVFTYGRLVEWALDNNLRSNGRKRRGRNTEQGADPVFTTVKCA